MITLGFIFFLASRNVKRYWKRSLQTFVIIFMGACSIMIVDAYMRGFTDSTENRIVAQYGHADAHAPGYLDSIEAYPLDIPVRRIEQTQRSMLASARGLTAGGTKVLAAASILTAGMLSNGEASSAGAIYGADPFALDDQGVRSSANPTLMASRDRLIDGRFFSSPADRGAILDEKLSKKLGIGPGDGVILIGSDAFGSFGMAEIPVIGVGLEGSLPNGAVCLTDLKSLQTALGMEDQACAVSLWFGRETAKGFVALGPDAEKKATRAVVQASQEMGLDARPFALISAEYASVFDFLSYFMLGMMLVFALVAGTGMANAILLSVQERTKDLGTLRAIALSSRGTGLLVAMETFMVGCLAALCAYILCLLALWIMIRSGLSFSVDVTSGKPTVMPTIIRPTLLPLRLSLFALFCAFFPLLSALFPIRVASRLTIREALAG
jgi:putative ABC transport system permease protein